MAARIHLQFATPDMRLARAITDSQGRLVAGVGTALLPGVVRVLRHMAVQSVMVDDVGDLATWECVRTAEEEHQALVERFAGETMTPPLAEIRAAIGRRIERRRQTADTNEPGGGA